MPKSKFSMKLLIDTNSNRVLFAEAEKDCVDFLFHILTLPLASVIRLLREHGMVGSLANLYESIENLNEAYIQPGQSKNTLLKPILPSSTTSIPLLLLPNSTPSVKTFYRCNYTCSKSYVSDDPRAICPHCFRKMTSVMKYVASPPEGRASNGGGFVKGMTYMVMDDLVVKPLFTISGITLLGKLSVEKLRALQEKVVNVTMTEAVMLLKASLYSDKVLTEVFVKSKRATTS